MAVENALQPQSFDAGADLSGKQYYFVKLNSSGQVVVAGAGENPLGVLQNKPAAAGRAANVAIGGRTKVVAGGTIAAGDYIACDSDGKAASETTGDTAICGVASSGGAAGEIIDMVLQPIGSTV